MPKRFRTIVKEYIAKNYKEPFALTIPIFIRRNIRNGFDYYDPVERRGGGAGTLQKLQDQFREFYRCGNCGGYHVPGVIDLTDPERPVKFFFWEFLDLTEDQYQQRVKVRT
jgi:hypothetical protein